MNFKTLELEGPILIELERNEDERGFFARTYCSHDFQDQGLNPMVSQASLSYTKTSGTLRGMHYQVAPSSEAKLVRCIKGAVWDVLIDMRPDSPTYLHHVATELNSEQRTALYVPEMFAHGYLSLLDNTELFYQTSHHYSPEHEMGIRFDDPTIGISWPHPIRLVSKKDLSWPLIVDAGFERFGKSIP